MIKNAKKIKEPLCSKTWFIILMLFVFFPVSIYGMWKYKKFNIVVRILISVSFTIICLTTYMQLYEDRDNIRAEIESEKQASIESSIKASIRAESERVIQESREEKKEKEREKRERYTDDELKAMYIDNINYEIIINDKGSEYNSYGSISFDFGYGIETFISGYEVIRTGNKHMTTFRSNKIKGNMVEGWEDKYKYYKFYDDGTLHCINKTDGRDYTCAIIKNLENTNSFVKKRLGTSDLYFIEDFLCIGKDFEEE